MTRFRKILIRLRCFDNFTTKILIRLRCFDNFTTKILLRLRCFDNFTTKMLRVHTATSQCQMSAILNVSAFLAEYGYLLWQIKSLPSANLRMAVTCGNVPRCYVRNALLYNACLRFIPCCCLSETWKTLLGVNNSNKKFQCCRVTGFRRVLFESRHPPMVSFYIAVGRLAALVLVQYFAIY